MKHDEKGDDIIEWYKKFNVKIVKFSLLTIDKKPS
jgi:hypothetical protein